MAAISMGASRCESAQTAWVQAHEALSRLAKERAAADAVEGRCLLAAWRAAAHVHLGFGSFGEYVERMFGYARRSTQEKLRVAETLEELPAIAEALETGSLNWSCARELTRVAVANTEHEWLEAARGKTVRDLETLVADKAPGDTPSAPSDPSALRYVLRFDVTPETLGLFREAMNELRRSSGTRLDDDSALMLMARHVLGGPGDAGRASYQIALSICPECGCGSQRANGELVPVGAEVVAMADCDGQHLGLLHALANERPAVNEGRVANDCAHTGASTGGRASSRRPSAHAGAADKAEAGSRRLGAHAGAANKAEASSAPLSAHAEAVSEAEASSPRLRAHVGAATKAEASSLRPNAHTRSRAKQTIAPAVRRAVLARDHHRCAVPGCRNALFLDLHHIELRSEGGGNETDNLVTLCGAHHRAAHRGELGISGRVSSGVRFRHADGSDYGHVAEPVVAETQAKAFAALRGLGFREREVRRVLVEQLPSGDGREPQLESVLRQALARLTARDANS